MFVSKSMFQLMDDWRNFAVRAHEHNKELLQLAEDITKTNKRCIAYNEQLSRELGIARSDIDQLIYKLECLLCHATGSKLSKHTYDLRTMESAVNDYVEECCDEARAEAKSEVAREIFEEISKASVGWGCYCITTSKAGYLTNDVNRTLAELKKKYTEDQK